MAELIRVENVTKRFGDVVALDRINISFESGKIYGITGRNGSGKDRKSTRLNSSHP